MGKCIIKLSTRSSVSLLLLTLISDVSLSWYPPSMPHDVQVPQLTVGDFPSNNVPSPIYSAAQMGTHLAFDKEPAEDLRWKPACAAPYRLHEADSPTNQVYRGVQGWHTILLPVLPR